VFETTFLSQPRRSPFPFYWLTSVFFPCLAPSPQLTFTLSEFFDACRYSLPPSVFFLPSLRVKVDPFTMAQMRSATACFLIFFLYLPPLDVTEASAPTEVEGTGLWLCEPWLFVPLFIHGVGAWWVDFLVPESFPPAVCGVRACGRDFATCPVTCQKAPLSKLIVCRSGSLNLRFPPPFRILF